MMDFPGSASRLRPPGVVAALRQRARMMMRGARSGEVRLRVLALVVAVAAVTSVGFLADRVGRALQRDASQMLGADLVLDADEPISAAFIDAARQRGLDVRSEEHTSELQSLMRISYAVFCLKKKTHNTHRTHHTNTSIH